MPRFLPALAALALAALPAAAETYTLLIYESPGDIALRTDTGAEGAAYWQAYSDFSAELGRDGVMRGGAPLIPDREAYTGELVLGGYFQIETASRAAAEAYAAEAPSSKRGGRTVVAEHLPTPGMIAPQ
ncbi:MAG: hypothetical protein MUE84_01345 [Hyphomonas sp.]|jgi:hypothetical protein|nr:hypothetical protein [Hyphomonas sp.]